MLATLTGSTRSSEMRRFEPYSAASARRSAGLFARATMRAYASHEYANVSRSPNSMSSSHSLRRVSRSPIVRRLPPLRECRDDVEDDWGRVWRELRQREDLPADAPWSKELERVLRRNALPGNLRDLQRLAVLCMAWWASPDPDASIRAALAEWQRFTSTQERASSGFGEGSRTDRIRWFRVRLAQWAKQQHGTWAAAAEALGCDEKTLRQDAAVVDGGDE